MGCGGAQGSGFQEVTEAPGSQERSGKNQRNHSVAPGDPASVYKHPIFPSRARQPAHLLVFCFSVHDPTSTLLTPNPAFSNRSIVALSSSCIFSKTSSAFSPITMPPKKTESKAADASVAAPAAPAAAPTSAPKTSKSPSTHASYQDMITDAIVAVFNPVHFCRGVFGCGRFWSVSKLRQLLS
ncbi:hypothetical protein B0H65DRAFT_149467 [Neurospora tetraspora]|uniref:Uncharacterized protein n=1 Tax=Neurospora tetraspora TaxID=94610 RepID=A0AAE0JGH8_9PEZI|nr:hypothetical protein B0H65DRAFT_149467 [Neurospora tetraspora]